MRILSLVLVGVWLAAKTASCADALPSKEFILSPLQSRALFSEGSRSKLISVLKSVPWQEADLKSEPFLLFMSGQSLDADGKRVLNRVQLFSRPGFDVWIKGYREVIDYNPKWQGRSMVEWNGPHDHDILQVPSCIECHFKGSGVRSPLMRQNADSILYLTRSRPEMPMEYGPLKPEEINCLELWLNGDEKKLLNAGCTKVGTVGHAVIKPLS